MLVRAIHAFVVVAVLIQCSPLRACALAKLAFGTNCHDRDVAGVGHSSCDGRQGLGAEPAAAIRAHHGPDHHHVCACERPKAPTGADNLAAAAGMTALPLVPVQPWSFPTPSGNSLTRPGSSRCALPSPPSVQLPLLC